MAGKYFQFSLFSYLYSLFRWWSWSIRRKFTLELSKRRWMLPSITIILLSFHKVWLPRQTSATQLGRLLRFWKTMILNKSLPRKRSVITIHITNTITTRRGQSETKCYRMALSILDKTMSVQTFYNKFRIRPVWANWLTNLIRILRTKWWTRST